MTENPADLTSLIADVNAGRDRAWETLLARIYDELHHLAHREMRQERAGHLLQTTALVHEAYLRLVHDESERYRGRAHFFTAAATAMRRVLIDEARRRRAAKRGAHAERISLTDLTPTSLGVEDAALEDLEALDRALTKMEQNERLRAKCRIVELRFFVGLTIEQTAEVTGSSPATVKRDWEFARAWLRREVG